MIRECSFYMRWSVVFTKWFLWHFRRHCIYFLFFFVASFSCYLLVLCISLFCTLTALICTQCVYDSLWWITKHTSSRIRAQHEAKTVHRIQLRCCGDPAVSSETKLREHDNNSSNVCPQRRNETETKQFQNCFGTVLFPFHFVVRTV